MNTLHSIAQLRAALARARQENKRIGLVPTMGNLHDGHIALVAKALQRTDYVVVSIFVNPLQFGANEDLDSYPRTLAEDQRKLLDAGAHLIFAPNVSEIYPEGMDGHTLISVPVVSEGLCGASRPGHFNGVSTVVGKLLNIVQPDLAVFGEKDFQQLAVIRKMAHDLCLPVQIMGAPIVRAEDGLALSSRNGYLGEEQRRIAPRLYQTLQQIQQQLESGRRDFPAIIEEARLALIEAGFQPDYLDLREAETLQPVTSASQDIVILAAAFLGATRLIDNLRVSLA
ncbi:pantoate--beta-alanine ligase [Pseudomonas sp. G11-1]|uniref:Pantothenate synthetase n=1 Tax=Halopseudomonas bauzanensis TaxID=653930 RepID=A0A1I4MBE3_9GAMM|nr:pantoate--beta-alanine ligase [Halopseudomonas bauzanensis]MCO5787890.1 pantoate--beta-alanine ligase [Pseudomonas sp. G11-1]MCO5791152.1 pantoate--beta-alanine ligase [Pseudomonas sp. G11-2]TKA89506.1 pantoate--beta-alanine ligase [Halopseudomonas bauzanensis]SER98353.1 pantothenate synthetase [Halopseudomonas bauzanensis]SFM00534.1 pantoate--beta-alanine ligase [Halopseudomonas bauzanensis]